MQVGCRSAPSAHLNRHLKERAAGRPTCPRGYARGTAGVSRSRWRGGAPAGSAESASLRSLGKRSLLRCHGLTDLTMCPEGHARRVQRARGSRLRCGFALRGSRWTPVSRTTRFTRSCACGARQSRRRGKTKRSPARDGNWSEERCPYAPKVTPTVAAGSARAAREVDAGSRGEGGDGRLAHRAPRASSARDGALVSAA